MDKENRFGQQQSRLFFSSTSNRALAYHFIHESSPRELFLNIVLDPGHLPMGQERAALLLRKETGSTAFYNLSIRQIFYERLTNKIILREGKKLLARKRRNLLEAGYIRSTKFLCPKSEFLQHGIEKKTFLFPCHVWLEKWGLARLLAGFLKCFIEIQENQNQSFGMFFRRVFCPANIWTAPSGEWVKLFRLFQLPSGDIVHVLHDKKRHLTAESPNEMYQKVIRLIEDMQNTHPIHYSRFIQEILEETEPAASASTSPSSVSGLERRPRDSYHRIRVLSGVPTADLSPYERYLFHRPAKFPEHSSMPQNAQAPHRHYSRYLQKPA